MISPFSSKNSKLILFLLLLISILSIRSGKYTSIVNILFFGGLFFYYRIVLTTHSLRYFALIIFFTIWGIIHGNNYDSIIEDVLSFSPIILLFIEKQSIKVDLDKRLSGYLANSLLFLIPISFLIFKYMNYGVGTMLTTRFNYDESTKLALFAPIIPILFAPYLLFFFEGLNKKQRYLIHSAIILTALMGIVTLSRSVVIYPLISYLLYYGHNFFSLTFRPFKFLQWTVLILLFGIAVFQSGIIQRSGIEDSLEGIIQRTNQQSDLSSGRFDETANYLNQDLDISEYLFGRGMGGHKVRKDSDPYIGGVNMMHIGPSHVFLKGGIILLLILYIPAFLAIIKFWKTPNYPISLILLLFLIGNVQTTSWSWSITLFFYWYGISYYWGSKRNGELLIQN